MQKLRMNFGIGKLTAIAAGIVMVCPYAGAGVTSMLATGSYSLDGAATSYFTDTYPIPNGSGTVDVLTFPYSGPSYAGLHSYGSTTGNFGTRSSGTGVYDVTGSFRINETITNTSGVGQNALFNFFITPGQISLDMQSVLTGPQFLTSGLNFDIKVGGNSVWSSSATLFADANAPATFTQTGTNLYQGGGNYYAVNGGFRQLDLGFLAAGASIDLSYEIDSFARGNSAAGDPVVVPATSYWVPDQWIEQSCYSEGGPQLRTLVNDGYPGLPPTVCVPGAPILIPGHTVNVPGYTNYYSQPSGSGAQSGDPFNITFFAFDPGNGVILGATFQDRIGNSAQPELPEPGTLALMLAGLGIFSWNQRRRQVSRPTVL